MSNMPSTPRQQRAAAAGSPRNAPLTAPMSERQQMALLMQMTSQDKPTTPPINPGEERRRNRQQRNERGETPLHLAAKKGDQEQVQKLLEQGMKPDVTDFAGWTPLHEACSFGWSQIVETLVGAGANVNARGLDDDTPLHDAASTGNLQMVQFLVEHGADPCAKNNQGKMPSDFASEPIYNYLVSVKESAGTPRGPHPIRARDDNSKKGNASTTDNKRIMEGVGPEGFENKDSAGATEKTSTAGESKDEGQTSLSSGVVSSTQDDNATSNTSRQFFDSETGEGDEDEASKRKKRKEEPVKEAPKPVQPSRGTAGRVLTGTKPPGPASKTGAVPLGKASQGASVPKPASNAATKSTVQAQSKGAGCGPAAGKSGAAQGPHPGKSTGVSKGGSAAVAPGKGPERKSPEDTPKLNPAKETMETDSEETKTQESSGPKVPPLKIVIPGGVGGSTSSGGQQEGEGSGGRSGGSKGRHSVTSLPYIIPCTATDGQDSPDSDEKKAQGDEKRVLRSHRSHDEKDKDDRTSPQSNPPCPAPPPTPVTATDTPTPPPARPATTTQDEHPTTTTTATTSASTTSSSSSSTWSGQSSNDFHPRKRKIKASKESLREPKLEPSASECAPPASAEPVTQHSNPYQLFIDIRKQIERRQKGLFPVQPKPPQGFKDYLMNRGTYLLQRNIKPMPQVTPPVSLSALMRDQYMKHEKERHNLRIQHIIEKEKLVLCVEQEILRVHGRAARALANQALPFSACTILRDNEVYNAITPEQEEKERNAQRSRYNGRLFLSWLQDVDDKWEKIKEGMVRRHHLEAETLHSVQKMQWEWKLKEHGLCDHKTTAKIDTAHVPQVHVSDDFDLLPA